MPTLGPLVANRPIEAGEFDRKKENSLTEIIDALQEVICKRDKKLGRYRAEILENRQHMTQLLLKVKGSEARETALADRERSENLRMIEVVNENRQLLKDNEEMRNQLLVSRAAQGGWFRCFKNFFTNHYVIASAIVLAAIASGGLVGYLAATASAGVAAGCVGGVLGLGVTAVGTA